MYKKFKKLISKHLSKQKKQFVNRLISKIKLLFYTKEIGLNCFIDKTVYTLGWNNISIGNNCIIGEYSWLNLNYRSGSFKHIKISNNCYLGKRTTISSGKEIIIKDFCLLGDDCKLLGSQHIYDDPMEHYASSGVTNTSVIILGTNVWLGTMVCIIGNVKIGHGSIIGANSVVTKNIPPFSIAVGNPAKIIKRFDFQNKYWANIDKYDSSLDKYMPSELEYLVHLQSKKLNVDTYKLAASHSFGDIF